MLFPLYLKMNMHKRQSFVQRKSKVVAYGGHTFTIVLEPENGFVDTEIHTSGVYEPDILSLIAERLPVGGTFVDIGANIGQHSLFAAMVVRDAGSVISFEPIPRLVQQFTESIALNGLEKVMTLLPFACSDHTGEMALKIKPGNIGGSGLHHADESYDSVKIKTIVADGYLMNLPRIDLIKIDTEGHEIETLRGLEKVIHKYQPNIIVEFSPSLREDAESYAKTFLTFFEQNNYTLYDLEEGYRKVEQEKYILGNFKKAQTNLLCLANNS